MIPRLRGLYFFYYAGVGTFLSYFAPYLRGLGFSGEQIGAVTTVQQLVAVPCVLLWGGVADRLGTRALRLSTAGALVVLAALPFARTPLQMALVLGLSAMFTCAVVPLADSATVELTRASGQSYSRTRLFGSVGFVLTAQAMGLLLALRGDRPADPVMPWGFFTCVLGYAALAQTLPAVAAHPDRPHWREALSLLRPGPLLLLLVICALHWGALSPYHLLFGVLVRDRGLSSSVTGMGMALGVLAEVGALFAFPWLEKKLSLRSVLALSFAASALRWVLLARAQSAGALVGLQLLHGLSFGAWWGAAVAAMSRLVPQRLRASGQALFSAVVFGAGNAAGFALSGAGYDRLGSASPLFLYAAAAEALALLLLALPFGLR